MNNYARNNPSSKSGHILKYWGLGLARIFLENTIQTQNRR